MIDTAKRGPDTSVTQTSLKIWSITLAGKVRKLNFFFHKCVAKVCESLRSKAQVCEIRNNEVIKFEQNTNKKKIPVRQSK